MDRGEYNIKTRLLLCEVCVEESIFDEMQLAILCMYNLRHAILKIVYKLSWSPYLFII